MTTPRPPRSQQYHYTADDDQCRYCPFAERCAANVRAAEQTARVEIVPHYIPVLLCDQSHYLYQEWYDWQYSSGRHGRPTVAQLQMALMEMETA